MKNYQKYNLKIQQNNKSKSLKAKNRSFYKIYFKNKKKEKKIKEIESNEKFLEKKIIKNLH